ncbi:MAG: hypothetical protein EXR79_13400 [Myxococcales bacterium]|nr:hypothetical protein [Myxococcales bacterium]
MNRASPGSAMTRWVCLAGLVVSCSGPQAPANPSLRPPIWQPPLKQSVYLRAVFDDDPSINLGRFFKQDTQASEMDESQAFPSRCSKAFSPKLIGSGGTFDETFTASSGVGASLSAPVYGSAKGSYGSNGELRVKYTLKGVMRAQVDADALARCCEAAPDQCSGKYVAEFYLGDGDVYQFIGNETDIKASGSYRAASAGIDYHNGTAWKQVTRFQNMYFAYKTASVSGQGVGGGTNLCASDWQGTLPQSLDGQYFVGTSKPAVTDQAARNDALLNGRLQAVQYIGTAIRQVDAQWSKDLDVAFGNDATLVAASAGIASMVKDRCWQKPTFTPAGTVATALIFFPNSEIANAARALAAGLQSAGKISVKDAEALSKGGAAAVTRPVAP